MGVVTPESDPREQAALAECRQLLPNVSLTYVEAGTLAICKAFERTRSERRKLLGLCRIMREYVTGDDGQTLEVEAVTCGCCGRSSREGE